MTDHDSNTPAPEVPTRMQRLRRPLMLGGMAVVAIVAATIYFTGGRYVSTDNAYVRAAQATISADISGRVVALEVHENQVVKKGDVLFRLDDASFRIAVDQARAQLAAAVLEVESLKAGYRQKQTELQGAQETRRFQQAQYDRQHGLLDAGISSQAGVEQTRHALDSARSEISAIEQARAGVLATLGGDADLDAARHPRVLQAKAALDRAELDLRHTVVEAPDDGVVTKVDQLHVGDYLSAATPAFVLVSTRDVWVEANFKEVQLRHVLPGQSATVSIDVYDSHELKAHVGSVGPGTGAQFSVLPAENATGNWVKVVQRLPVRIELDATDALPILRSGLSATVTVDTGENETTSRASGS